MQRPLNGQKTSCSSEAFTTQIWQDISTSSFCSYQTYYPYAQTFTDNKVPVLHEARGRYDLIICFGTKHKAENLLNIAQSHQLLQDGGTFIFVMPNKIGAKSYRQHIFPLFELRQDLSKNRCKIFVTEKTEQTDQQILAEYLAYGSWNAIEGTPFYSLPGVFSWQKTDAGSALLLKNLPDNLSGTGADLGAGYGYLSYYLLKKYTAITHIHMYEAEYLAIKSAQHNLSFLSEAANRFTLHWADATLPLPDSDLDWVIMNPPFHAGKHADIQIGQDFIRSAARMLRAEGSLYMVANRHLPYENLLQEQFQSIQKLAEEKGFKVFYGRR